MKIYFDKTMLIIDQLVKHYVLLYNSPCFSLLKSQSSHSSVDECSSLNELFVII